MVIRDFYKTREDGVKLFRTYSDKNCYIQKKDTDELYSEAIDVEDSQYEYIESELKIEDEQTDTEVM